MSDARTYTSRVESFYEDQIKEEAVAFINKWPSEKSLWIDAADVQAYDESILEDYVSSPRQTKRYFERALQQFADGLGVDVNLSAAHIRLTDPDGVLDQLGISGLEAAHIGTYVAVKGQLSKVTAKKPLLTEGAFQCHECGSITREPQPRHRPRKPTECDGCEGDGPFSLDITESRLVDQRKLKLETPPDEAAQAEGTSTTVYTLDDLCDYGGENGLPDHAGERVTVLGQRKIDETGLDGRNADPECDTWIDAEAIVFHGTDDSDVDIEAHEDEIKDLAASEYPVERFRDNIVPTLEADEKFETVLEAIVAWLFGSYRVDQEEGQYRGDIHMGLIGDPGTGKSTLLSEVAKIAPVVEYRSGTGLSEVGLTAAAIHEEFAGKSKWTLQPGILPRANGGHCIIDEVDDVLDGETKAIHDALEGDQMVKIDKAGISADLETRTAALVSGNPEHGRFNRHDSIAEQVDLDPALISRMDVLIDLIDTVDKEVDESKAEHYLEAYDEISAKELSTEPEDWEMIAAERDIPIEVLRAWVAYARENCFPRLTEEAKAELKEFYLSARNLNDGYEKDGGAVPVTLRTLGAGVRLSTAFARCELSDTVEPRHAKRAKKISQQMIGLNWDPQTQQFDAAKTDTGDLNRWQRIRKIIGDLEEETGEAVPVEDVVSRATDELSASDSKIGHEIEKLKRKGEAYEPESGTLRTT